VKSLIYDILITLACFYCVWTMFQPKPFRSISQFQQELIEDGYDLPKHGADGRLGDETETAWNAKFHAENGEQNE
jgi:peptidoglycan hydrolase-like protein with peptidoglycan-binding domain